MTTAARDDRPDDMPDSALETAIQLLEMGLWPVVITPHDPDDPQAGKRPLGERWGLERPTEETLRDIFGRHPDAGVGIRLGPEGGVIDLDCDGPQAEETLVRLLGGECIETLGWDSERGNHLILRWDDRLLKYGITVNEHHTNYPGVGLRFGGPEKQFQSVCPPSRTSRVDHDGRVIPGRPRRWNGCWTIAPIPSAMFADLDRHVSAEVVRNPVILPIRGDTSSARRRYALSALDREVEMLRSTPEGGRNDQLNRSAFALGQLVGAGALDYDAVVSVLVDAARQIGLGDREIAATVRSGMDDGKADPRNLAGVGTSHGGNGVLRKGRNDSFEGSEGKSLRNDDREQPLWKPPRLRQAVEATPFPLDVLPVSLAGLCQEGARAIQCPVDYFGAASLALAGGAIGLSVNLTVKAHYEESPALYMAVVGPSGGKKTPVIIKILALPFYLIDRDLREQYEADRVVYEEQRRQYEVEKRKGDAGPPPVAPVQRQLTLDDTTREAVAMVHSQNPRCQVLIKDELTSWVASLDAYRAGKGDDRQFWLKVNSGSLVKVNRKGNQDPIIVARPCMTIVGGLTPDMLSSIRGSSSGEDGWVPRILFSYPEPIPSEDWTEATIPDHLLEEWSGAVNRLWRRPMVQDEKGRLRPYFVRMEDEAKPLWTGWVNAHRAETRSLDFPKSYASAWSKMEGYAARLALILSQLRQAYGTAAEGPPRNVSPADIAGACKLANYFKAHFRRSMVDLVRRWDVPDDCDAILKWIRHSGRSSFSERDAKLNFPGRFRDNPLALSDAEDWLITRGCIRALNRDQKTGRPHTLVFEVNPFLFNVPGIEPETEVQ